MVWIELILCAGLIMWAGSLLSKYGNVIAEKTGLGRAWIGPPSLLALPCCPGWPLAFRRWPGNERIWLPGYQPAEHDPCGHLPFGQPNDCPPGKDRMGEVLEKGAKANDYDHTPARRAYIIFILSAVAVVAGMIFIVTACERSIL